MALLILEDAEDTGEPRDAGVLPSRFQRQAAGAPDPMPIISLHSPSGQAILVAVGFGGGIFLFSLFFRYGNAMPTDGAVQSRDCSLWQSVEKAADEHGILIIKHNER